jgi:predicted amidohydrolase YtcJ
LNRFGITSIHDIARLDDISEKQNFPTYTESSYSDVQIFRDLRKVNQLTVRVYAFMPLQTWRELKDFGISPSSGDDMIRYGILKDFTDGTLMFEPYASDPNFSGDWTFRFPGEEVMARNIREADRAGFDIGLHIIGDKALHYALDWYEAAMKSNGPRDRRLRLLHVWFARGDDLKRAGQLGLIADVTPIHLLDDPTQIEKVAGPERAKTAFAWRTMVDDGIRLDIVSDLPGSFNDLQVSPFNPLDNIYYAITRNYRSGKPWHPEQCMTLQEAIVAYTANPAFASREEKLKGTITPGKLADLVVLSKDILTIPLDELRSTEVLYTILGGKFVYEKSSANETSRSADVKPPLVPQLPRPDSASASAIQE